MTKEEFVEKFSGAPFDDEEVARIAAEVKDADVASMAIAFLHAREEFFEFLEDHVRVVMV